MNLLSLLGGVPQALVEYLNKRSELKATQRLRLAELENALHQKKLENIAKAEDHEAAWNIAQIANSGWKDEYWTIVLSIPFIGCFIPFLQGYIIQGFEVIKMTPPWYQYFVGIAVAAAFGFQQATKAYNWWVKP